MYNNPEIIESGDVEAITAISYAPAGADGSPALLVVTFALNGNREYADPPTRLLWPGMPQRLLAPVPLADLIPQPAPEEAPAEASAPATETSMEAPVTPPVDTPPAPPANGNGKKGNGNGSAASSPTEGGQG